MSAHVFLNLFNYLRKRYNVWLSKHFFYCFAMRLMNLKLTDALM